MTKAAVEKSEETPLEAGAALIRKLRSELMRLATERARISTLVAAAQDHDGEIEVLKRERRECLAAALVGGGDRADVTALDERIAAAESAACEALADGETARDALALIDERAAPLEAELTRAIEQQLKEAVNDLAGRHKAEILAYNTAVEMLRAPIERMLVIESLLAEVRRHQAVLAGDPHRASGGPGLSFYLRRVLSDEGLRVIRQDTHATWPPAWLMGPQTIAGSQEYCRDYLSGVGLS